MNSQKKGKSYELEIAHKLECLTGIPMKRTGAQEKWKSRSGDVNPARTSLLSRFHWELKKRESWNILEWYKKAKDDAEILRTPVVVCSKNHEEDYVFMRLEDFTKLLVELDGFVKESEK